jgi:tartrate-resistant acid phosphatase type 5
MTRGATALVNDVEAGLDTLSQPLLGCEKTAAPSQPPCKAEMGTAPTNLSATTSRHRLILIGVTFALFVIAAIELSVAVPWLWDWESDSAGGRWPVSNRYPRFLVIGDWGRDGDYNQTVLADMMARKAAKFNPDFVVSTGDNFYEWGLTSVNDPQFDSSFRDIYSQPELANVPWHVALGNHDYGETDDPKARPDCSHAAWVDGECFYSPVHQLDVQLTARDPRWHCERSFTLTLAGGEVEIFFIDTTPIMSQYYDAKWANNRGGLKEQSWEDQVRELEASLARSKAAWKLVVGHHPVRTNHRPDLKFKDMVDAIEPVLIDHGVSAYFCGHDHNLQHIHHPKRRYHQITSGAGSAIGAYFYGDKDSPFQWGGNGFVAVELGRDLMRVEYIGVDSLEPLFSIDVPRLARGI